MRSTKDANKQATDATTFVVLRAGKWAACRRPCRRSKTRWYRRSASPRARSRTLWPNRESAAAVVMPPMPDPMRMTSYSLIGVTPGQHQLRRLPGSPRLLDLGAAALGDCVLRDDDALRVRRDETSVAPTPGRVPPHWKACGENGS